MPPRTRQHPPSPDTDGPRRTYTDRIMVAADLHRFDTQHNQPPKEVVLSGPTWDAACRWATLNNSVSVADLAQMFSLTAEAAAATLEALQLTGQVCHIPVRRRMQVLDHRTGDLSHDTIPRFNTKIDRDRHAEWLRSYRPKYSLALAPATPFPEHTPPEPTPTSEPEVDTEPTADPRRGAAARAIADTARAGREAQDELTDEERELLALDARIEAAIRDAARDAVNQRRREGEDIKRLPDDEFRQLANEIRDRETREYAGEDADDDTMTDIDTRRRRVVRETRQHKNSSNEK